MNSFTSYNTVYETVGLEYKLRNLISLARTFATLQQQRKPTPADDPNLVTGLYSTGPQTEPPLFGNEHGMMLRHGRNPVINSVSVIRVLRHELAHQQTPQRTHPVPGQDSRIPLLEVLDELRTHICPR